MGITPASDTNLGQIVVDSSKFIAEPTTEPTSIANFSDKALADNGKPKGAGKSGKEKISGVTTREGADIDKDGIPNLFDADEDNDGIRNGVASTPKAATVISNTVEAVVMNSNIWASHGTAGEAKDLIDMRLHVYAKSGHLSEIQSVECIDVPATIKDAATIMYADSLGSPEGYPTEGSHWKDVSYRLYKTTTLTSNEWIVSVVPRGIMNVGDIFTIRVHYTSGGSQDFFIATSYVLTDWARIVSYNGTTLATAEGKNTTSEAATFSTSTLEVVFSKPKDEGGVVLNGLIYSVIIGSKEAGTTGTLPVPSNSVGYPASSYPFAFTDGLDTMTVSLDKLVTFEAGAYYYITPVAESADGQRNGEQTWFKKQ